MYCIMYGIQETVMLKVTMYCSEDEMYDEYQ